MKCEGWAGFECENINAVRYKMDCAYQDEEKNYKTLCPECQEASDEYWKQMWDEYYGLNYYGGSATKETGD